MIALRSPEFFPTLKGSGTVLLDVGANAECKPENLRQFAIMGSIYSRMILGVRNPRVGLMSIGEEDVKGTDLTKDTARLLKESPVNFIGNVEGRDIFTGDVDVIVADGFTGNVILKTSEGLAEAIMGLLKTELGQTLVYAGRRDSFADSLPSSEKEARLFRVWRRAAARSQAALCHLSRTVHAEGDTQCDTHCKRVLR